MTRSLTIVLAFLFVAPLFAQEEPKVLTTVETAELFKKIRENPPEYLDKEYIAQAWIESTRYEPWTLRQKNYAPSLKAGAEDAKADVLVDPLGMKAESAKFVILFKDDEDGEAASELKSGTLVEMTFTIERRNRRRIDGPVAPIVIAFITKMDVVAKPAPAERQDSPDEKAEP